MPGGRLWYVIEGIDCDPLPVLGSVASGRMRLPAKPRCALQRECSICYFHASSAPVTKASILHAVSSFL